MREIPLTQGKVALVDDADYESLAQHKWFAQRILHHWYAVRRGGRTYMHREILKPGPGEQCDHVDGNGLNNLRSNLRRCTPSQNQQNRRKQVGTKNSLKGTRFHPRGRAKPWSASIWCWDGHHSLGYYATEEEAARAYDAAAREKFGEFALCNFPES